MEKTWQKFNAGEFGENYLMAASFLYHRFKNLEIFTEEETGKAETLVTQPAFKTIEQSLEHEAAARLMQERRAKAYQGQAVVELTE